VRQYSGGASASWGIAGPTCRAKPQSRAINSAGECHLHTVEATGSIPVSPTIISAAALNLGSWRLLLFRDRSGPRTRTLWPAPPPPNRPDGPHRQHALGRKRATPPLTTLPAGTPVAGRRFEDKAVRAGRRSQCREKYRFTKHSRDTCRETGAGRPMPVRMMDSTASSAATCHCTRLHAHRSPGAAEACRCATSRRTHMTAFEPPAR
jgi:hypothetical protein